MGCNVTTALIDTHCSLHIVNMPAADKIVKTSGSALIGAVGAIRAQPYQPFNKY